MKRIHPSTAAVTRRLGTIVLAFAATLPVLAATASHAATITWNNASGGSWSNAANWSPATVPGSGDVAVLPALSGAYTVTLDANPVASQISIAAGDPTLDMNGKSFASVGTIENSGTIANFAGALSGSQLHNNSGGSVLGAYNGVITMAANDTLTNDGTIVIGPGASSQFYSGGNVYFRGSGTLSLDHTHVVDATGAAQTGGWLVILAGQTLTGTGLADKRILNYGNWVVDDDASSLVVHAVAYNRGTILIRNHGTLQVASPLLQCEQSGIIRTGDGGGTLSMQILDNGVPNGNYGDVDLLRGGGVVIADGGDLNLHCGQLYGGPISRTGDTGVLNMDMGSMQQLTIDSSAEVLWTNWAHWETGDHLVVNGLLRLAGQFICGLADTSVKDTTWLSGTGTLNLEGGILGTGETGRTLVNQITITGHGTINPPFTNQGTVNLDGALFSKPGRIINGGTWLVGRGALILTGANTRFTNVGQLVLQGASRIDKSAGIDNTRGVISVVNHGSLSIGSPSTTGAIAGGRLEGADGGEFLVPRGAMLRDVTLGRTGLLHVAANGAAVFGGTRFTNLGTVQVDAGGHVAADVTTQYLQTDGVTRLAGGSLVASRDVQLQGGALRGFGTVQANLVNRGTVAPDLGASPLRVAGNYTQLAGGALQFTLGGTATNEMSHFDVSGNAALAGSLVPTLATGFVPTAGQSFGVFTYGSMTGSFDPMLAASGSGTSAPAFLPYFGNGTMTLVSGGTTAVGGAPVAIGTLRFFGKTTTTGTSFVLELPFAADLKGRVYDAAGREVAKFADGALPAGVHTFAINHAGGIGGLASGVYFARLNVAHGGANDVRIARAVVIR